MRVRCQINHPMEFASLSRRAASWSRLRPSTARCTMSRIRPKESASISALVMSWLLCVPLRLVCTAGSGARRAHQPGAFPHHGEMTEHPEDLPWNDAPADSDAPLGSGEPDPAEVSGDEDDPAIRDASLAGRLHDVDEYRRETLDERLSEEEPDRAARSQGPEAGELQAPESGDDDIALQRGEPDLFDAVDEDDDESAEDAAVHVIPER